MCRQGLSFFQAVVVVFLFFFFFVCCFFFQAEDGIRYLVRSRGLGDVYKRQEYIGPMIEREVDLMMQQQLISPMPDILRQAAGEFLSLIHI